MPIGDSVRVDLLFELCGARDDRVKAWLARRQTFLRQSSSDNQRRELPEELPRELVASRRRRSLRSWYRKKHFARIAPQGNGEKYVIKSEGRMHSLPPLFLRNY